MCVCVCIHVLHVDKQTLRICAHIHIISVLLCSRKHYTGLSVTARLKCLTCEHFVYYQMICNVLSGTLNPSQLQYSNCYSIVNVYSGTLNLSSFNSIGISVQNIISASLVIHL